MAVKVLFLSISGLGFCPRDNDRGYYPKRKRSVPSKLAEYSHCKIHPQQLKWKMLHQIDFYFEPGLWTVIRRKQPFLFEFWSLFMFGIFVMSALARHEFEASKKTACMVTFVSILYG